MTHRVSVHDVPTHTTEKTFGTVGEILARQAASAADADPNTKSHLGIEEHEASARALTAANQRQPAIQSWHRAAIGHARAGNAAGVIAAILKAEHLADNHDFTPDIERKATAADAITGGEVFGDDDDTSETAAALDGVSAGAPDPDGEVIGGEPGEGVGDEG